MLNIKGYDSKIRKTLNKYHLFGRAARRTHFWSNVLLDREDQKGDVLALMHTTKPKESTSAQTPHTNCQHSSEGVMLSACSVATGYGHLTNKLLCMPEYSRVKCEATCVTAKA